MTDEEMATSFDQWRFCGAEDDQVLVRHHFVRNNEMTHETHVLRLAEGQAALVASVVLWAFARPGTGVRMHAFHTPIGTWVLGASVMDRGVSLPGDGWSFALEPCEVHKDSPSLRVVTPPGTRLVLSHATAFNNSWRP